MSQRAHYANISITKMGSKSQLLCAANMPKMCVDTVGAMTAETKTKTKMSVANRFCRKVPMTDPGFHFMFLKMTFSDFLGKNHGP